MRAKRQAGFQFGIENIQRPGDFITINKFRAPWPVKRTIASRI